MQTKQYFGYPHFVVIIFGNIMKRDICILYMYIIFFCFRTKNGNILMNVGVYLYFQVHFKY